MKRKIIISLMLCVLMLFNTVAFSSCDQGASAPKNQKLTASFMLEDGTVLSTQTVKKGDKLTEPTAPTSEGLVFDGWYIGTHKWSFDSTVNMSVNLVAKFVVPGDTLVVTFDTDGGSVVPAQSVAKGEKIVRPANPTKEGYGFYGWYANGELWSFESVLTDNITLVAQWTKTDFATVTFNSNGGSAVEPKTVTLGKKMTEPTKPTRAGYDFDGWYLNGEKWNFSTAVTGDMLLIANWTKSSLCPSSNGVHSWRTFYLGQSCTSSGYKIRECVYCYTATIDTSEASTSKPLGHKWVEDGQSGDGWKEVLLGRERKCLREGCDYSETVEYENTAHLADVTVNTSAGVWSGGYLPERLLVNGITGDYQSVSPKQGSAFEVYLEFEEAISLKQLVIVARASAENHPIKVYLWYEYDGTYSTYYKALGEITSTTGTDEGAICLDMRDDLGRRILGIKIVDEAPGIGTEDWYEIMVGVNP